jgi:hypothetical protein
MTEIDHECEVYEKMIADADAMMRDYAKGVQCGYCTQEGTVRRTVR